MERILLLLLFVSCTLSTTFLWDDKNINELGSGFDILTAKTKQAVFQLESLVRSDPTTETLTKTLPAGIIMKNMPYGTFDYYAEVIDRNKNVEDSKKVNIKSGGSLWSTKFSFSLSSEVVKKLMTSSNHRITIVKGYQTISKLDLQIWGVNLTRGFRDTIIKIRNSLDKNTNASLIYAIVYADEILNTYGTHISDSIELGGALHKIDQVDITSWQSSIEETLSASASASYASIFNIGGDYTTKHMEIEKYKSSVTATKVEVNGGKWKTGDTYNDWVSTININPAVVGTDLISILDVISDVHFPDFTPIDILKVKILLEERMEVYFRNNYYKGCPDVTASNYVSYANVFDENLCNYEHTFHLGGIYTISNNLAFQMRNVLTNEFSCPDGYVAFPLLDLSFQGQEYNTQICHKHGHLWWKHKRCTTQVSYDTVTSNTYVCLSKENRTVGMYFGGAYSTTVNNDMTEAKSCPDKYSAYPIYHNYQKSIATYICMAPFDSGRIVSTPFGGIFSSQYPNYQIGDKPVCGDGFERHPIGPQPTSDITYCVKIGSLGKTKEVIPPGYGNTLHQLLELYEIDRLGNGTRIGLPVDPIDYDPYFFQVAEMVYELLNNNTDAQHQKMISFNEFSHMIKWAELNGIGYHIEDLETSNNFFETFITVNETDDEISTELTYPDGLPEFESQTKKETIIISTTVIGGVFIIVLIVVAIYCCCRHRTKYNTI